MSRSSSQAKVRQWADRLERFRSSGQTVAWFCDCEGVSVPSFYQWRKKLGVGSGRRLPAKSGDNALQAIELSPARSASVTIRLPNGIVIELDDGSAVMGRVFDRSSGWPADSGSEPAC